MSDLVTPTAMARELKVTDAAVFQAMKRGRLTFITTDAGRRMLDPVRARREWTSRVDPDQQARGAGKDSDESESTSLVEEKTKSERARAELLEMEVAERRGELVAVTEVVACWGQMTTALRARLLVLPTIAAPLVAAPGRAPDAQATLQKLINEALNELADGIPQSAVRRARRDATHSPAAA